MEEFGHEQAAPPNALKIAKTFLYVGFVGFGGGLAILAHLRRAVVETRRWLTDGEFTEGVSVIPALPGVIAANITCYIGFKLWCWKGATLALLAMVLPAFLSMLLLSEIYLRFKEVPAMERVFRGLTPAIVAFILLAAYKMGKSVLRSYWDLAVMFFAFWALSFLNLGVVKTVLITGGLGLLALAWSRRPTQFNCCVLVAGLLVGLLPIGLVEFHDTFRLLYLFLRIGTFTFGGGYVMVPFLESEVVRHYAWLTHREFADSVALGQITPGPVIITATFVGYKVLGLAGATLATLAVFLPSYLIASTVSHYYQRFKASALLQAFLRGVAPSAVGMLASAALTLSKVSVSNALGGLVTLGTLIASLRFRIAPPWIILFAACLGWLWG